MYLEYWGLKEMPFENTSDTRFFYRSAQHEEGLSRLLYVVQNRKGAALLTGVFGCGKTVVGRALINGLNKNIYQIAFVTNPHLKAVELLRAVARLLGGENLPEKLNEMSSDYFLEVIGKILTNNAKDGKETLVIIDEAHVITDLEVLEELRLLLNFQLEDRFLLTLILMGQPELDERIHKTKQLIQRIALGHHLGPLSEDEISEYIKLRLNVAGCGKKIFEESAIKVIAQNSGGIPRRINQICDMSLLTGFVNKVPAITGDVVSEAVEGLGV